RVVILLLLTRYTTYSSHSYSYSKLGCADFKSLNANKSAVETVDTRQRVFNSIKCMLVYLSISLRTCLPLNICIYSTWAIMLYPPAGRTLSASLQLQIRHSLRMDHAVRSNRSKWAVSSVQWTVDTRDNGYLLDY
ncbi:hypothetical protein T310_7011, partial [Rasamsonia emersonii CBS 393.64]